MARWNGAAWRPLGPQTEPRLGKANIVCLHTMVGYLKSTEDMFEQDGYSGVESHFGVGGKWGPDASAGLDGVVYQWQDTDYQADANGPDGNDYVISIETADNAPADADDLAPWTERQLDAIVELVTWCCQVHDIPATLIPDTKPGRRGIGYHRQGCDPFRADGGDLWSSAYGKVCPGDQRVNQVKNIIIPRVQAELAGDHEDEEDNGMWLAHIQQADGTTAYYYGEPAGKRRLKKGNWDRLANAKAAKNLGAASSDFLGEFPTFLEDGTHGGSTDTKLKAADDAPPS